MYAQTSNTAPTGSVFQNYFTRGGWPFQLRHPEAWIAAHGIAAAWLISLGTVLCTHGFAWGALMYLSAAMNLALGYRLRKTIQTSGH
jgi:hypothetical protein